MFVRSYLRASTVEQDATRARAEIQQFVDERGVKVAAWYVENESGAKLNRPKLFELLNDCQEGDVLLIEGVDRLSRLTVQDWTKLRREIDARGVRVVSLDLPTSWDHLTASASSDGITSRLLSAVNVMLLDVLAAVARKDYEDRRRRQSTGIANAKAKAAESGAVLYKGRIANTARNDGIADMLKAGTSWGQIQEAFGCSRSTISRVKNHIDAEAAAEAELRIGL